MITFCSPVALKYGERLHDSFTSTNLTSLLACFITSLLIRVLLEATLFRFFHGFQILEQRYVLLATLVEIECGKTFAIAKLTTKFSLRMICRVRYITWGKRHESTPQHTPLQQLCLGSLARGV